MSDRRAVVAALLGIFAFYAVFQARAFVPAYNEVDPDGYLVLAKRIARLQSPALPDDPFLYNTHVWVEPTPGAVVPKFAPGYPAILAIFYRLFGDVGMFYVSPLMGALALLGAFVLFRAWLAPAPSVLAVATLAVNGAFLFYSGYALPHATELCVVTWGMAALWRWLREPRVASAIAAGLLLGYACTIRHTAALLAGAVAWALVSTLVARRGEPGSRRAPALALLAAYAVFPLAMLAYDAWLFGSPVVTGYALSDEQLPLSWRAFFRPETMPRPAAFTWDALAVNYTNLLHGLNYELMFMVFPLGVLGMLVAGPVRERVLRGLWCAPLCAVYAAYYFNPPNLAFYRFLLSVVPLFVGAAFMLLERVTVPARGRWLLLAALPVVVAINGLGYIERTLALGPRPGAAAIALAAGHATATLRPDAVIFAAPPLQPHLGTRRDFRVYATVAFAADYGRAIDDENAWMQASRRARLQRLYRLSDDELRALQHAKIRAFVARGRQVVFLVPPAEVDDYQRVALPTELAFKRVDEWDAPDGGRWGLYAVVPAPPSPGRP